MTDRMLDIGKVKEKLRKKLANGEPLTEHELRTLNSNRAERRAAGFVRQNQKKA